MIRAAAVVTLIAFPFVSRPMFLVAACVIATVAMWPELKAND